MCDREDHDGITAKQLQAAIKNGWKRVERVQRYSQAVQVREPVYETDSENVIWRDPEGYGVYEWWTHLGECPECSGQSSLFEGV
jgi:hypothetical protein